MVFRKAIRRVKKFVKKRYGTFKQPNMTNIVSDVQMLKRLINVEKKYVDVSLGNTIAAKNAATYGYVMRGPISAVAEGNSFNQRSGQSTKCTSIYIKGTLTGAANQLDEVFIDMYVFQYKRFVNLGTTPPLIENMFEADPKYSQITTQSLRDMEHMPDFRILRKKRYYLPAVQITGNPMSKPFECAINLGKKGIHQRYEGATAADLTEGGIYVLFLSSVGDINLTQGATATGTIRTFYVDN